MSDMDDILKEARFLLERLNDFAQAHCGDDISRDWNGHVLPSISRLDDLLREAGI